MLELKKHVFVFNKDDNGGEQLFLCSSFVDNNGAVILNQELTLQSYCNSASFNLSGAALTPELLRKLANELEAAQIEVEALMKKKEKVSV